MGTRRVWNQRSVREAMSLLMAAQAKLVQAVLPHDQAHWEALCMVAKRLLAQCLVREMRWISQ